MKGSQYLATLFEKHQPELMRLVVHKFKRMHHEAEDIVQDAFHNILRVDNIDHLENPRAYLYQTASNLALNRIRKHKNQSQYMTEMDESFVEEPSELTLERTYSARQDLTRLEQSIEKLPQKYRRTFLLSRVQDKTYKEISIMLDISESTVEKHIIKALKYLRDQLNEVDL